MKIAATLCTIVLGLQAFLGAQEVKSAEALQKLIEGNKRYASGTSVCRNKDADFRESLVSSQSPFATIVTCSDSRVPPELIFDQGLGDIFVVRVAGNVVGPLELDSIEYSVDILKSQLIVVLGHQNCGAVNAVLKGEGTSEDIENIAPYISPAIKASENMKGDRLENAIKTNAALVAKNLKKQPVLKKLIDQNQLNIVSGYYSLDTGKVEILK